MLIHAQVSEYTHINTQTDSRVFWVLQNGIEEKSMRSWYVGERIFARDGLHARSQMASRQ